MSRVLRTLLVVLTIAALRPITPAMACPFCAATQQTISEEMASSDAAVIVKLVAAPAPLKAGPAAAPERGAFDTEAKKTVFEIVQVLKGEKLLGKTQRIEILYFGQAPPATKFLVMGTDPKDIAWSTPTPLSERAVKYVAALPKLPEKGIERLAFFQEYFEDPDSLLANDVYDEFAKAPYAEVQDLKTKMHREKLIGWIKNPEVAASHRRLYLTMLGICGGPGDLSTLEEMIRNDDRQIRQTLDAMIACYLNLKGPDGMPMVEDLFLKNAKADYVDTYATIMALRFHGQETNVISKERLTQGLRHMLDRPKLADLVIPDLARWQDWGSMDRLVKMFKDSCELAKAEEKDAATGNTRKVENDLAWVRVPIVQFLRACPLPEAKGHIEELRKLDPDSVKSAMQFLPIMSPAKAPPSSQRPKTEPTAPKPTTDPAIEQPSPKNRADVTPLTVPVVQATPDAQFDPSSDVADEGPVQVTAAKPVVEEKVVENARNDKSASEPATLAAAGAPKRAAALAVEAGGTGAGMVLMWSALAGVGLMMLVLTILRGGKTVSRLP